MSRVVLIEAQPWAPNGTPVAVRLAGGGSRGYTHRGSLDWIPGVSRLPRFTSQIGFDVAQGGFTGGSIPTTGAIGFQPSDKGVLSALSQLVWVGAPITVLSGDDALADPAWTVELAGTVAGLTVRGGEASFTISDLSGDLGKPLLTDRFAGTGGVEGIAEAKDRIKRRSWGRCWNVEARILDKANSIYELGDPARPLQAIDAVKDRGRAGPQTVLAWQGSIAATFAALQAASAPSGGAVVAPSIACVKWWTQPAGPLTADLRGEIGAGYVETLPTIAARIVAARSTLQVSGINEVLAVQPGAAGLHADQESETAAQALDRLLSAAGVVWIVEPSGLVRFSPVSFANPVEALVAIDVEREAVYKPVTEVLLGYQRNQRQHSDGELSAVFQAGDGTYLDGTPIEDLKPAERGANVTATNISAGFAGQGSLATRNFADWASQVQGAGKPENGATVGAITGGNLQSGYGRGILTDDGIFTQLGISAGFTGQGALATRSYADWSTQVLGSGKPEDGATNDRGDDTRNSDFSPTYYRLNWLRRLRTEFKTLAVVGLSGTYGALETYAQWSDNSGGPVWQRITDNAGRRYIRQSTSADGINDSGWGAWQPEYSGNRRPGFTDGDLLETYGGAVATLGNFKTGLGTAAAISGQGALATQSTAGWSQIVSVPTRLRPSPIFGESWLDISVLPYSNGAGVDSLRPQEAGANVTEFRVASAVAGQGAWATYAGVAPVTVAGRVSRLQDDGYIYSSAVYNDIGSGGFLRDRWPQEAGANVTESRVASAVAGQGSLATRSNITDGFLAGALAVRLQPHPLNTNYLGTDTIAYPDGAGVSALQPQEAGANKTETRIAAAIVGQGSGATASSLAQLDPSAASQLAAVAGGGVQVAALYEPIRKVMAPGAAINFDAAAGISAGGDSGNVGLLIQVSLADANSWSNIAAGTERFVSASEPAYVTASGSFTNTSGAQRVYEFRAIDVRTPGSAGGGVVGSQSFLRG